MMLVGAFHSISNQRANGMAGAGRREGETEKGKVWGGERTNGKTGRWKKFKRGW